MASIPTIRIDVEDLADGTPGVSRVEVMEDAIGKLVTVSDPANPGSGTRSWVLRPPDNSGAVLSDPSAVAPTFLIDRPGTYVIVETFTDTGGSETSPTSQGALAVLDATDGRLPGARESLQFGALGWSAGANSFLRQTLRRARPSDTTAMQRLVKQAIREGGVGGAFHLFPDEYLLEDQIYIDGIRNFKLDFSGSLIRAGGAMPDNLELFLLNNCRKVKMVGGLMQADVDLLGFIAIQQGPEGTGSKVIAGLDSTMCSIDGVELSGRDRTAFGCRVKLYDYDSTQGIGDVKNDHHRFRDVTVSGMTFASFVAEGRNSKALIYDGCVVQGISGNPSTTKFGLTTVTRGVEAFLANNDALRIFSKGAHFNWYGGQLVNNQCDFEMGDHGSGCSIIMGPYSEKSGMALSRPLYGTGQTAPGALVLLGYKWNSGQINSDHVIIDDKSGCALVSLGCQWGSAQAGRYIRINKDPTPPLAGPMVFDGNFLENDGDGQVFPAQRPDNTDYTDTNYAYSAGVQSRLGAGVIIATDGPNSWRYPASAAQWSLLAHASGTPNSYWTMQGNGVIDADLGTYGVVDAAGARDLFQFGTPEYLQTLGGWSGYFVKTTETAGEALSIENNGYSPASDNLSGLWSGRIIASASNRVLITMANSNTGAGGGGLLIRINSSGQVEVRANGVGSTGSTDYRGRMVYLAWRWNLSTTTWEAWIRSDGTSEEHLSVSSVALVSNGSHKGINFTVTTSPPEALHRFMALYYGALAANVDDTLLDALGVGA